MRQQCPEVERETVDVEMCDGPMGTLLRRPSRKAAREATDTSRYLAEEWVRNKSSRQDGASKRPAVGSPQVVEPSTSDPLYVPVLERESSGTDDSVTCLEPGEEELLLPLPMTPHV